MRDEFDRYYSPPWVVRALLERLPIMRGASVLEPFAGDGAMREVLAAEALADVSPFDIAPPCGRVVRRDSIATEWSAGAYDHVITNPPFRTSDGRNFVDAIDATRHAARLWSAYLLRITALEPTRRRGKWLADRGPDRVIVLPRARFRRPGETEPSGTDSATVVWAVWGVVSGPVEYVTHKEAARHGRKTRGYS